MKKVNLKELIFWTWESGKIEGSLAKVGGEEAEDDDEEDEEGDPVNHLNIVLKPSSQKTNAKHKKICAVYTNIEI